MKKKLRITIGDKVYEVEVEVKDADELLKSLLSFVSKTKITKITEISEKTSSKKNIRAPISGKVVKILAKEGNKIRKGDPVLVLESMKTHVEITSHIDGIVKKILVKVGDFVKVNQEVVVLD